MCKGRADRRPPGACRPGWALGVCLVRASVHLVTLDTVLVRLTSTRTVPGLGASGGTRNCVGRANMGSLAHRIGARPLADSEVCRVFVAASRRRRDDRLLDALPCATAPPRDSRDDFGDRMKATTRYGRLTLERETIRCLKAKTAIRTGPLNLGLSKEFQTSGVPNATEAFVTSPQAGCGSAIIAGPAACVTRNDLTDLED